MKVERYLDLKQIDKDCDCKFSDAWRCAVSKGLSSIICHCKCHKYIDKEDKKMTVIDDRYHRIVALAKDYVDEVNELKRIQSEMNFLLASMLNALKTIKDISIANHIPGEAVIRMENAADEALVFFEENRSKLT